MAVTITPAMHRAMADEAKATADQLRQQLAETESVEAYHRRLAGKSARNGAAPHGASDYKGLTNHGIAAAVIERLGPSTIPDIVDHLIETGYGDEDNRRAVYNAIYTALKRKKNMFAENNGKWGLKEG